MKRPQRISTIGRLYPDEWVLVEVTRVSQVDQALAGQVLAHARDEDTITRETRCVRGQYPEKDLWAFYTGDLIAPGTTVALGLPNPGRPPQAPCYNGWESTAPHRRFV